MTNSTNQIDDNDISSLCHEAARKEAAVLRRHSDAITRLMYRACEVDSTARAGDRVRVEVAA